VKEFFRFSLKNTHNSELLGGFFRLKIEDYGLFYTSIDSCKGLNKIYPFILYSCR